MQIIHQPFNSQCDYLPNKNIVNTNMNNSNIDIECIFVLIENFPLK